MQRIILLVLVFSVYFVATVYSQEKETDPTMIRANSFVGKKPPEAFIKYQKLRKEFLKDCSREDQIAFYEWEYFLKTPILVAEWKREWNEYPESHIALSLYIRDEIKKNKYLRTLTKLNPNLDDNTLFHNYLNHHESFLHSAEKQTTLEQKLAITDELKNAAKIPASYQYISMIYGYYTNVQSVKKLTAQIKSEEAAAAEARRKIVPVERTSKEYQDALSSRHRVVEAERQAIANAEQNDLTWKRAKYLLEKRFVASQNINKLINEFVKGFDETKMKKFQRWQNCFERLTSVDVVEREWNEEPISHPAILFLTNVFLKRIKQDSDEVAFTPDKSEMNELLKGDKTTIEKYHSILKQKIGLDHAQLELLEKELRIPANLKKAIKEKASDATLFLYYETYFREFTPDELKRAKHAVHEAIQKLNSLRPNWAYEEKIEFPDHASRMIHEYGLDKEKEWTWLRIILLSSSVVIIFLGIVITVKKHFSKRGKNNVK
jgi:hypothetical protein